MRTVDTSLYSADKPSRIKPDSIDLSALPRIEKPAVQPDVQEVFISEKPSPSQLLPQTTERNSERSEIRTEQRTENRSVLLPVKRKTRRYSFEFYDDQLTRLKRLKYRVENTGENITLSDMVRQAVDQYLKEQGG